MYNFAYHKPNRIDEAIDILKNAEDGKILAGGQTLIATMKLRLAAPSDLIDLGGIEGLGDIKKKGDELVLGSMATHTQVTSSDLIQQEIPSLSTLASQIGDQMIRNLGTIGGSIANNDPAADYPAAALGLGATIVTDSREISADDFFTGMYETCLQDNEIIKHIAFPIPNRSAYIKFKNPASRYAIVGVMVAEFNDQVRVAVTGAGNGTFRIESFEKALTKDFSEFSIKDIKIPTDNLIEDMHASATYRAHLIKVITRRAVQSAM